MGILRRLRERGEGFFARRLQGQALALCAAIPGKNGPICEVKLEAASEPQADGERLRLRAHLHLRLGSAPGRHRDVKSWVELRASNASLDDGAGALVPEKLNALGIQPQSGKPLQTWAGALRGGHPGFAMLTLLRLDKAGLPAALRRLLGARPFQLSGTVATVVEET